MWCKRHKQQANPSDGIARLRGCAIGGRNGAFWAPVLAEEPLSKGEPKIAPIRNRMAPEELENAKREIRNSKKRIEFRADSSYDADLERKKAVHKLMTEAIDEMHPDDADELRAAWNSEENARGDAKEGTKDVDYRAIIEKNTQEIESVMGGADDGKKKELILGIVGNWFYFPKVMGRICELPKDMQKEIIIASLRVRNDCAIKLLPLICEQEERHYGELYAAFAEFMNAAMARGRMRIGLFADIDIKGEGQVGRMALSFLPAMSKDEQVGVMGNALCSKLWEVRAAAIRLITSQPEADLRWMQKKALQGIRRAMGCESDKMAMDAFGLAFQQPKETHLGLLASALRRGKSEKMLIAAIAKVSEMDMPEKSRKKLCKLACHAVIRQENGLFRTTLNKDDLREATARMPHEYRKRIMGG